jgi:hypothetical protein
VAGAAQRADTCRFGDDLDVVYTSCFPSIGAVNRALTAMANAIRVGGIPPSDWPDSGPPRDDVVPWGPRHTPLRKEPS